MNTHLNRNQFRRPGVGEMRGKLVAILEDYYHRSVSLKKQLIDIHQRARPDLMDDVGVFALATTLTQNFKHEMSNWGISVFVFCVREQDEDAANMAKYIEYIEQTLTEIEAVSKGELKIKRPELEAS